MIYMDNAATTMRKPDEMVNAMVEALNNMGNAGRGVNEASLKASTGVFDTRVKLAEFFNAEDPSRIAFTLNSTESLNIAIKGIFNPGDHVITTVLEHNSVLRPLYEMEEKGVELSIVGCSEDGLISFDDIEKAFKANTRGIVCTNGSNLTGNLIDIKEMARICHKHNAILIVDASQTAGYLDIDVQEMGIDVLCFTGHKSLMGPQGVGGIYVRPELKIRPLKSGGSGIKTFDKVHPDVMPTALEAGTLNGHGIAGLGGALLYINKVGLKTIREKELSLMWRFYEGVRKIPGIKIYGHFSKDTLRCPIVTLNIEDIDSSVIGDVLFREYDISVRTGGHCAPLMHEALGTKMQGAVRFSFSHFNTEDEVDKAIKALSSI